MKVFLAVVMAAMQWSALTTPARSAEAEKAAVPGAEAENTAPSAVKAEGASVPATEVYPAKPPETEPAAPLPAEYSCMFCHGKEGTLAEDPESRNLVVTEADLATDIHWQKGLRCHDCHGGNPVLDEYVDHRDDPGFLARSVATPADIPKFCGHCHSDLLYMRHYNPSYRTDQEAEYWTSGHGQRLKQAADEYQKTLEPSPAAAEPPPFPDPKVANCVSCHSHHNIRAVADTQSPVYPTRVAETCATCHADPKLMAGRRYHDRPLGHDQYDQWRQSVHGRALLEDGDLSAPTCNDCHGNHGAVPPGVDSVANACGTCHGKVAGLFAEARMKHKFEEVGLPGCATPTCHGSHKIVQPTDEMLGMGSATFCVKCHKDERYGATLAGAEAARAMRDGLDRLKQSIAEAQQKIEEAERLGMEVRTPRFDLRQAADALTNARSLIHSFARDPVEEAIGQGLSVTSRVQAAAEAALREHTARRVWLAAFLVPVAIVVVLLVLYIRTLPLPAEASPEGASGQTGEHRSSR